LSMFLSLQLTSFVTFLFSFFLFYIAMKIEHMSYIKISPTDFHIDFM
jgi:hypothetical protein